MTRKFRLTLATLPLLSLSACGLFEQDGTYHMPKHIDIPIQNAVHEDAPYTHVMGNPIPDAAWSRERYSECEPWQVGKNGCPKTRKAATIEDQIEPNTIPKKHHTPTRAKPVKKQIRGS